MNRPIIAYFSHSYRPEDRRVNMEVWKRLNAAGVVFSVDPPDRSKRPMDVTFLERMMQRSDCFIAIVPDRSRSQLVPQLRAGADPSWSPYQELEYRLALRANKPSLLVVERGIGRGPVPDDRALWFDRAGPTFSDDFDEQVRGMVRSMLTLDSAFARRIGILRWNPPHPSWTALASAVQTELGDRCEMLDVGDRWPDHRVLAKARQMSAVVVDLSPRITPAYVLGMLHGAAVPLYRTCRVEPGGDVKRLASSLGMTLENGPGKTAAERDLPRLLHGYQVDDRMQPVLFWTDESIERDALTIAQVTDGYAQRDRMLEQKTSAREYFLSLRGNRVFVSTPGDLKEITKKVAQALDDAGMPAFHYKVSALEGGKEWKPQIAAEMEDRDLLLGFISPTYWDRPECVEELAVAVERWERHDMQIVLYAAEPFPPLPPFLMRSQVNRIGTPDETVERVVAELHRRFAEGAQESLEAAATPLLEPIRRHLPLQDREALLGELVHTCRVPENEAGDVADRVLAAPDAAEELVSALIAEIGDDRYGGPALGRLCYLLRARETAPETRDEISALFSSLRLFPGLHDVRAWNRRRERRDVTIRLKPEAPTRLLAFLTQDPGNLTAPKDKIRFLGHEVAGYVDVLDPSEILDHRDARVYAEGKVDNLLIPLEWAEIAGMDAPLSRVRPFVRRVVGAAAAPRASLEKQFDAGLTGPPRVLLFGDESTLPHVGNELDVIARSFADRYAASRWPVELITRVPEKSGLPVSAPRDTLRTMLDGSDYEVLHLAGHAGFRNDEPVFQVSGGRSPEYVRGEELAAWVRTSMVRFVYLSCCEGAATPLDFGHVTHWRRSLCKELIDAGVAEIVAYVWKVSDDGSVGFTKEFYDVFVKDFDAPAAIHEARRTADRSDALWAASVLVQVS
jgi:hypothetical protein